MTKIALGAVQFGLNYGISNKTGQVSKQDVAEIFKFAYANGINVVDTASNYGSSEQVIGSEIGHNNWKIITKTPKFNKQTIQRAELDLLHETFNRSLLNLGVNQVYGLIVHSSQDLLVPGGKKLYSELEKLKSLGVVSKIGASVYTGEQIDELLNFFNIDIIQLPLNVFDQRLVEMGYIDKLKNRKIEIHARSVFLQGLALMPIHEIPSYFSPVLSKIKLLEVMAEKYSMSKLDLSLNFIKSIDGIDSTIVGITSLEQLKEIIQSCSNGISISNIEYSKLAINNSKFVNPSKWVLN